MKTNLILFLLLFTGINSSLAQTYELGLNYYPHKFLLTNEADRITGSGYTEILPNILSGTSFGVFFNKNLNPQNGLQFDLNFLHQRQYYLYTALSNNTSSIFTSLNSINLNISHNLYLWDYENNDNVFFSYGLSLMNIINSTDYYSVETENKSNGVTQKETRTTIIENGDYVSASVVTRNDSIISVSGDARQGDPRYKSFNIGANVGLNFLHYFNDNVAFTAGVKGVYYFLNPENRGSNLWDQNSKYKYGNIPTSDKREASKLYSYGVSLSLIYCFGRY